MVETVDAVVTDAAVVGLGVPLDLASRAVTIIVKARLTVDQRAIVGILLLGLCAIRVWKLTHLLDSSIFKGV